MLFPSPSFDLRLTCISPTTQSLDCMVELRYLSEVWCRRQLGCIWKSWRTWFEMVFYYIHMTCVFFCCKLEEGIGFWILRRACGNPNPSRIHFLEGWTCTLLYWKRPLPKLSIFITFCNPCFLSNFLVFPRERLEKGRFKLISDKWHCTSWPMLPPTVPVLVVVFPFHSGCTFFKPRLP